MSDELSYGVEIGFRKLTSPEGWLSIDVTPRYSYQGGVRGMFPPDSEEDDQREWLLKAIEVVTLVALSQAEAKLAEELEADEA